MSEPRALRLCRLFIGRGASMVPRLRRTEWRREWEAELEWAWADAAARSKSGTPSRLAQLRLLWRTKNCIRDAAWLNAREWMTMGILTDLRVAGRMLLRRPGFTLVAVVTLGVGLGSNAAIFGLLDHVVLRPLPYPEQHRLVSVVLRAPGFGAGFPRLDLSDAFFLHYRDNNRTFEDMGAWTFDSRTLTGLEEPMHVVVGHATPGVFRTVGVRPLIGRLFTEEEGEPGGPRVALLSHSFWERELGGEESVRSRVLTIDGEPFEVVGVLPAEVSAPFEDPEIWISLQIDEAVASQTSFQYATVGRLREGITPATADADLTRVLFTAPDRFPGSLTRVQYEQMQLSSYTIPLRNDIASGAGDTLWLLFGAVALVLLIAWANVANLVLVRSEGRRREMAVRGALGATQTRLVRLYLAESALLSVVSGAVGLLIAWAGLRALVAFTPGLLPRLGEVQVDGVMAAYTGALVLLSGLFFGLLPRLRGPIALPAEGLREGARGTTMGRASGRVRDALVVAQIALSLIMLTASGLMIRSFWRLQQVDPGFESEGVLTLQLLINRDQFPTLEEGQRFWNRLAEDATRLQGVESAGMAGALPTEQAGGHWGIFVEDQPLAPGELPGAHLVKTVTLGYLEALSIPVSEGRGFEHSDLGEPFQVALVNEGFARDYWPDQSGLGKRIRIIDSPGASGPEWRTVVGIVRDVREDGPSRESPAAAYFLPQPDSWTWEAWPMTLVVRASGPPAALAAPLRELVWSINPNVPISSVRTMEDVVAASTSRTRLMVILLGAAAGISLLLGAVGLYGVVSYAVSRRTQELGVRIALGAKQAQVRRMVLRQGLVLGAVGVAFGAAASMGLAGLMQSLLFEVSPRDTLTLVLVSGLLLGIAGLACWVPASRAAGVDPVEALRAD